MGVITLPAPTIAEHAAAAELSPAVRRRIATFSRSEKRVIELLADGHTSERIARHLGKSERTIDRWVTVLLERTATDNRVHLVATAIRHKWIR